MLTAIQMDPIASINPRNDSTLILMLEAQARGHALYYYTPKDLHMRDGAPAAHACPITVRPDATDYYTLGEARTLPLSEVDCVLMRQDPPFDLAYITATHILERASPRTRVFNDPGAVRNHPEKLFPLAFPKFLPPTLISADPDAIRAFHAEQGEVVLKPLYGHGGRAVFRIARDRANLEALLELMFTHAKEPVVAQRFLPEVNTQERRIILIDGNICGAFGRTPASGDIRSNMRVGGTPVPAELTPRQRKIAQEVGAACREKGLLLAGLDVIGDWLTEINLTSPTGLRQLKTLYGLAPEKDFWDAAERRG
ncbi:MAG: glutathione synthase [Alphaproteobacteria bacterium]|nr:glutathione synthase [Alphaproteobacteria bacterium]